MLIYIQEDIEFNYEKCWYHFGHVTKIKTNKK